MTNSLLTRLAFSGFVAVTGCARHPQVSTMLPPLAYLVHSGPVTLPQTPVTNTDLANYLYDLYDSEQQCRQQLNTLSRWRAYHATK